MVRGMNTQPDSKSVWYPPAIKAARAYAEISQAELATAIGVNVETLGQWERGKTAPNTRMLVKLAEALNVSRDYFYKTEPSA